MFVMRFASEQHLKKHIKKLELTAALNSNPIIIYSKANCRKSASLQRIQKSNSTLFIHENILHILKRILTPFPFTIYFSNPSVHRRSLLFWLVCLRVYLFIPTNRREPTHNRHITRSYNSIVCVHMQ